MEPTDEAKAETPPVLGEPKKRPFSEKVKVLPGYLRRHWKVFLPIAVGLLAMIVGLSFLIHAVTHHGQKQTYGNQTNAPAPQITQGFSGNGNGGDIKWNAANRNGITEAQDMPSCKGTQQFSKAFVDPGSIDYIDPLGHVSSYNGNTEHVFPVDHMYAYLKRTGTDANATSIATTIYAPSDLEVFQVTDTIYQKDGKPYGHDYTLYTGACKELILNLGHVNSISPALQTAVDKPDDKDCKDPYTTGGTGSSTYIPCSYSVNVKVKAGDVLGGAGGAGVNTFAFDYGVYDQRTKALAFIQPKHYNDLNLHAVCGLTYYPDGAVKTSLFAKLKNTKKNASGQPDCGTNMWDKAGSAQGNWVLSSAGSAFVQDELGLVAIHMNEDPAQGIIDWGGTVAPADRVQFPIQSSGLVDRDPADVTADGKVYCFQESAGTSYAKSIKLQLVDATTLKAEFTKTACPSAPTLVHPTTYIR